jgi:type I restriction enzyme S subunit
MYQPKTISAKEMTSDGPYLVYGANGIIGRYSQFNHAEPQLLITCRGATCGSVNISQPKSWITGNAMVVCPKTESLNIRFLEYLFRGGLDITAAITGAAQPQITRTNLYPIEICFPDSVTEQKRIVAILDEAFEGIDTAVANAEKNLANARELFENYLNSVFVQTGNGWTHKKLGELAIFKNGLNFTKGSKGETIKIVGVKDFQKNFSVPMDQLETAQIDGNLSADYELRPGDILTVRSNGNKRLIGRCMLSGYVPEKTSHSGFTIRIRMISTDVSPAYLVHFLKSRASREMLVESGDGANISSLNQQALATLPVNLPSLSEQLTISEKIEAVAAETKSLESVYQQKLTVLSELKQAVLQRAFSGELTARSAGATPQAAE